MLQDLLNFANKTYSMSKSLPRGYFVWTVGGNSLTYLVMLQQMVEDVSFNLELLLEMTNPFIVFVIIYLFIKCT